MNITKIDTPLNDFLLELAKWHRENGREAEAQAEGVRD